MGEKKKGDEKRHKEKRQKHVPHRNGRVAVQVEECIG